MENNYGQIISQAYAIIEKTYAQIDSMNDDLTEILGEYDPGMEFAEEYSYGPKFLYLKVIHAYLYRREMEKAKAKLPTEDTVFGMVIIFDEAGDITRASLRDQPEIWFGKLNIANETQLIKPFHLFRLFSQENREHYQRKLSVGGEVINYNWESELKKGKQSIWTGRVIGYPLTAVTDRDFLLNEVVKKLYAGE